MVCGPGPWELRRQAFPYGLNPSTFGYVEMALPVVEFAERAPTRSQGHAVRGHWGDLMGPPTTVPPWEVQVCRQGGRGKQGKAGSSVWAVKVCRK